jgi:hypothetical protein
MPKYWALGAVVAVSIGKCPVIEGDWYGNASGFLVTAG